MFPYSRHSLPTQAAILVAGWPCPSGAASTLEDRLEGAHTEWGATISLGRAAVPTSLPLGCTDSHLGSRDRKTENPASQGKRSQVSRLGFHIWGRPSPPGTRIPKDHSIPHVVKLRSREVMSLAQAHKCQSQDLIQFCLTTRPVFLISIFAKTISKLYTHSF